MPEMVVPPGDTTMAFALEAESFGSTSVTAADRKTG
jgi:hypothetical protein